MSVSAVMIALLALCDVTLGFVPSKVSHGGVSLRILPLCTHGSASTSSFQPSISGGAGIFKKRRQRRYHRSTRLERRSPVAPSVSSNSNDDGGSGEDEDRDIFQRYLVVQEPRLLLLDMVCLVLVSQLLGFADILTDASFWSNGGFFQPISIPTTFGVLMRRDAAMSLAWLIASLKNGGYTYASVLDEKTSIKYTLNTFTDYCILRVAGALVLAVSLHTPVDGVEILRQVWFTAVIMCAFRLLFTRNNPIY